jgi:KaiC/GvpD/RAD55 family RecA-like ATPase
MKTKSYKISSGKEYIIVTVDESGAYIIKDMAGRKVFLSRYQAKLMKFGIENLLKEEFKDSGDEEVKVEELK